MKICHVTTRIFPLTLNIIWSGNLVKKSTCARKITQQTVHSLPRLSHHRMEFSCLISLMALLYPYCMQETLISPKIPLKIMFWIIQLNYVQETIPEASWKFQKSPSGKFDKDFLKHKISRHWKIILFEKAFCWYSFTLDGAIGKQ